jgi:hypothetical protein
MSGRLGGESAAENIQDEKIERSMSLTVPGSDVTILANQVEAPRKSVF